MTAHSTAALKGELEQRMRAGSPPRRALDEVYLSRFGERATHEGRTRFRTVYARMARRVALDLADASTSFHPWVATGGEVRAWMNWLERYDVAGSIMIDLCYFAGFTVKAAALILGYGPRVIVRELRRQKEHLSFQLPPV